ncbi:DUF3829 domain-containing protein [Candidatus Gracilibacteria bacterium]|nr:DUF3829 domain-containing protein [Candidatus Gracilibacteria bacterium]
MDNNFSSPTPDSSQSPFSGGWMNWIMVLIVFGVVAYFGVVNVGKLINLNNFAQQVQQRVDGMVTNSDVGSNQANDSALDNAIENVSELSSCMNYADRTIRSTIDYYDRFVDFQNPNKTNFTGLITESSWQTCVGNINDALAITADTPELDQAVRAFQKEGEAIVTAFKEITPYYKQKDFLDDDFALGRAKDEALMAQSLAYVKAADTFRAAVDRQEDLNNTAQMALLAQDPTAENQMISLQMFIDAKKLVAALSEDILHASALEKSINDLIGTQTKFATTVLPDIKGDSSKFSRWNSVNTSMEDFVASAKNIWRLVRDGKPVPASNEGSVSRAIEKFNTVVQNYNTNNQIEMYRL